MLSQVIQVYSFLHIEQVSKQFNPGDNSTVPWLFNLLEYKTYEKVVSTLT